MITAVRFGALALFAGLWFVISRTDLRIQKIPHRHLRRGLVLGACAWALLAGRTWWGGEGQYFTWGFYRTASIHIGLSAAASLTLWMLKVWPAGDAKLFALLSVLYPVMDPLSPLIPKRAPLASLINIFIPAALFIILQSFHWIWKTRVRRRLEAAGGAGWSLGSSEPPWRQVSALGSELGKTLADPAKLVWAAWDWLTFFAAAGLLVTVLTLRFGQAPWVGLFLCAFSFFAWRALQSLLGRLLPPLAWAAGAWYVARQPGFPISDFAANALHMAVFGGSIGLGMQILLSALKGRGTAAAALAALPVALGLLSPVLPMSPALLLFGSALGLGLSAVYIHIKEDTCDWMANDLQAYQILSPAALERIRQDEEFYCLHFLTRYPDGLTEEQASALREWCARNSIERLSLQRTLSFAFWIFLGFFLTLALRRDLIAALLEA